MRRLQYFSPYGGTNVEGKRDDDLFAYPEEMSSIVPPAGDSFGRASSLNTIEHEIGVAVWWVPPKDVLQATYVRHLEGEIHLESDLQPSSSCPLFLVEYFVEMLPFVSGFEPEANLDIQDDPRMQVLSSYRVEIATSHSPGGPIPVAFSEPSNSPQRPSGSGSRVEID